MPKETETFEQFWIYYLSEHSKKGTRILHFIGTGIALLAFRRRLFRPVVAIIGFAVGYTLPRARFIEGTGQCFTIPFGPSGRLAHALPMVGRTSSMNSPARASKLFPNYRSTSGQQNASTTLIQSADAARNCIYDYPGFEGFISRKIASPPFH